MAFWLYPRVFSISVHIYGFFLYSLVDLVVISKSSWTVYFLLNPLAAVLLHLFYSFDPMVSICLLDTE
ncbi:uncharacterized protein LACBIDRAFT_318850 [Laccaria bicolor S238N-H82]|uniref:Predicted protein n=1 Tax=Laccaria bicolor (strain S238N-H82 / ATCC MYA-4686) TaxID=486041 RepID=B0D790_LACBS|nr:uncharacterized protein LACBIDRAFT_318850 [Laccaria bicolor S238N-H82]EDR09609.1 predicted protein [Laccaria bicolor S238N-H82]|eukprot:XP_001879958.1 predicted protein [Laccaria bicolor S238N-H82]